MNQIHKPYDSVLLAKYLLAVAYSKGKVLNITKVQKLLYIAYGFFLAKNNRILISEKPKAWPFGPVFPRTRKHVDYSVVLDVDSPDFTGIKEDTEVVDFFDKLVDDYSGYSAGQLSEWSHTEGGPWDISVKSNGFKWNSEIKDDLIQNYFHKLKI